MNDGEPPSSGSRSNDQDYRTALLARGGRRVRETLTLRGRLLTYVLFGTGMIAPVPAMMQAA